MFIANANVICSLGHGLRTFTAALQHCEVSSALHRSRVAKSSTSSGWSESGNVTSDGWQVTLCDPIWHVSSRSGVAMLHCELLYPYTSLDLYIMQVEVVNSNCYCVKSRLKIFLFSRSFSLPSFQLYTAWPQSL